MVQPLTKRITRWVRERKYNRYTEAPRNAPHRPGIREIAFECASPMSRRVRGHMIEDLVDQLLVFEPTPVLFLGEDYQGQLVVVARRMLQVIERLDADIYSIRASFHELSQAIGSSASDHAKQSLVERYLADTSTDSRALRGDLKAAGHHLGFDVLRERNQRTVARLTAAADIAMEIVGGATERSLRPSQDVSPDTTSSIIAAATSALAALASRLELAETWTSRYVASGCMRQIAGAFAPSPPSAEIAAPIAVARVAAMDIDEHAWVQAEALHLLLHVASDAAQDVLDQRVTKRIGLHNTRDFLFRRLAVERAVSRLAPVQALDVARGAATTDPSEHVRIGSMATVALIDAPSARAWLCDVVSASEATSETSVRVRATAVIALVQAVADHGSADDVANALRSVRAFVATEPAALALGIACDRASVLARCAATHDLARFTPQLEQMIAALQALARRMEGTPGIPERASTAAERIVGVLDATLAAVSEQALALVARVQPGRSKRFRLARLPEPLAANLNGPLLGRTLAMMTRGDFGVAMRIGSRYLRIWRGDQPRRRAWRLIHEMRNRAPNKRQGWVHTVGRRHRGDVRAHPGRLDEQTATAVPGERVYVDAEGGWGRHLPLVDDVLDLPILRASPVSIYSSHGQTVVQPPASLFHRLLNRVRLTLRYRSFVSARLAALSSSEARQRARYVRLLREGLGVEVTFRQYATPGPADADMPAALAGLFDATDESSAEAAE